MGASPQTQQLPKVSIYNVALLQIYDSMFHQELFYLQYQLMEDFDHQQSPFFDEPEANEIPLQLKQSVWQFQRRESQVSFHQSIFGDIFDPHGSEFQQNVAEYRRLIFRQNVQKYAYSRSYHYYFDLDNFSRDPKSINYARDPSNSLRATFSKDQNMYGGSRLKDIINREYFTLPANRQNRGQGRPSRAKNPSHQSLFSTEDKKIGFDRNILTLRHLLNNIDQLVHTGKISQYAVVYKDPQLQKLLNQTLSISQKRQILINRLENMQQARRISEKQWFAQDNLNFAPSCNQRFYYTARQKLNCITQESIMLPFLYNNPSYVREFAEQPDMTDPYEQLKSIFTFAREDVLSIKEQTLSTLAGQYRDKIVDSFRGKSTVIFPTHIFSFGNKNVLKLANRILAKRLRIYGDSEYYAMNLLCTKLFNETQFIPDNLQIDDQYIFKLDASDFITKIREYVVAQQGRDNKRQFQLIDDQINFRGLRSSDKGIFVLKRQQYCKISSTEYIILMLWHWLCLVIQEMQGFLLRNQAFVEIISSPHYEQINQSVSEAFKSPIVGTLNSCIKQIRYYLRNELQMEFNTFRLEFQYDSNRNVGYLWRIDQDKHQQQDHQTKKRRMQNPVDGEQEEDYDLLSFGKRVKSLEGEWA